jgi:hypothetical protein
MLCSLSTLLRYRGSSLQGSPVGCEIPEHLDQGVWEGVQVHMELAHCRDNQVSSWSLW